ncbi:hypothetical protein BDW59DRAFT_165115 [Aspergillus cavernicola]|uniref:Uncharacterized protein n=1 Tax=Aspergillus cavernicola TaxID=176166 RepID=A0ABR4HX88_9EURO
MASRIKSYNFTSILTKRLPNQTTPNSHPQYFHSSTIHPITTQSQSEPKTPSSTKRSLLSSLEDELENQRQILSPERAETSYSGTDNAVGDFPTSYDPSTTAPESEFSSFEEETRAQMGTGAVDPLFISPANPDFSRLLDRDVDGRAVWGDRRDRDSGQGSVRGWVNKHKKVRLREMGEGKGGGKGIGMDEYERLLRGLRRVQLERDEAVRAKSGGERKEG